MFIFWVISISWSSSLPTTTYLFGIKALLWLMNESMKTCVMYPILNILFTDLIEFFSSKDFIKILKREIIYLYCCPFRHTSSINSFLSFHKNDLKIDWSLSRQWINIFLIPSVATWAFMNTIYAMNLKVNEKGYEVLIEPRKIAYFTKILSFYIILQSDKFGSLFPWLDFHNKAINYKTETNHFKKHWAIDNHETRFQIISFHFLSFCFVIFLTKGFNFYIRNMCWLSNCCIM